MLTQYDDTKEIHEWLTLKNLKSVNDFARKRGLMIYQINKFRVSKINTKSMEQEYVRSATSIDQLYRRIIEVEKEITVGSLKDKATFEHWRLVYGFLVALRDCNSFNRSR